MKIRRVGVVLGVALVSAITVAIVVVGRPGGTTVDSVAEDVTFLDEARTIPIASVLTFDINHSDSRSYPATTNGNGELPVTYTASLSRGEVKVNILNNGESVAGFEIEEDGRFSYPLTPNTTYTIRVEISNAAGNIDLRWAQGA